MAAPSHNHAGANLLASPLIDVVTTAAMANDVATLRRFVTQVNVNTQWDHLEKFTLLHLAVSSQATDRSDAIDWLIRHCGARLDIKNSFDAAPLYTACVRGLHNPYSHRMAETLLRFGADVHSGASERWSPIGVAVAHRRTDLVLTLLEYGADLRKECDKICTCRFCHRDVSELFNVS